MPAQSRSAVVRTALIAVCVSVAALLGTAGPASADVPPGAYTSTTWSGGTILLQRDGYVQGRDLVLIGRYRIHPRSGGYYVDFFPGHRVIMNSDGHGGYRGPALLGGVRVGTFTLTPRG
ncbi:hypothetical protein GII33_10565 [Gordonia pseudamarae]|jgi:hypothetical protein|uniref:Uncharacterized protein n=1 Tax=Gordonia pseudamarae TaxID=2831662 RepID=A0ABX6IJ27_9ACTN|nr:MULTISPECIES: hypothetical protein [Gordonia]MBD0022473.1 hypothetical protein [Gordonia sp. (in: high G+C Gram-positive bacteria)]QHN26341.1 hypothetical protein GII33_10565 [Gordonia pseudamarae]QHN35233.1 hypothetical protein GII31_10365 [Gordonia pseudamarae]